METITKKPIGEYKLAVRDNHSKKGSKGFIKAPKPKNEVIQLRVSLEVKSFIEEYCSLNDITITSLILAGLECYTFFDGSNAEPILERARLERHKPEEERARFLTKP
jgi:hypothetical protein